MECRYSRICFHALISVFQMPSSLTFLCNHPCCFYYSFFLFWLSLWSFWEISKFPLSAHSLLSLSSFCCNGTICCGSHSNIYYLWREKNTNTKMHLCNNFCGIVTAEKCKWWRWTVIMSGSPFWTRGRNTARCVTAPLLYRCYKCLKNS